MKKVILKFGMLAMLVVVLSGCSLRSDDEYLDSPTQSATEQRAQSVQKKPLQFPAYDSLKSEEPIVKKSTTGICHAKGSTYYSRTKNFVPYDSIEECLDSGGRLPKR